MEKYEGPLKGPGTDPSSKTELKSVGESATVESVPQGKTPEQVSKTKKLVISIIDGLDIKIEGCVMDVIDDIAERNDLDELLTLVEAAGRRRTRLPGTHPTFERIAIAYVNRNVSFEEVEQYSARVKYWLGVKDMFDGEKLVESNKKGKETIREVTFDFKLERLLKMIYSARKIMDEGLKKE